MNKNHKNPDQAFNADHELIANIGNEMRGSLNAVILLADHVNKNEKIPTEIRKYTQELTRAAKDASKIAADMWDFAALERNQVQLQDSRFSLQDILDYVNLYFDKQASEKGIAIEGLSIPSGCEYLIGDSFRLGQILINLIRNSVKFTDRGTISVQISDLSDEDADNANLKFKISDTGVSIDPEQMNSLFDVFTESHNTSDRRFGSYGLELAICKHLIKLMGGNILVHSDQGGGVSFEFDVKLKRELIVTDI